MKRKSKLMMLHRELLSVEMRQTSHLNMISELRTEHFQSVGYDKIWHLLSMSKYKGNFAMYL